MDAILVEDLELAIKNKITGINEYLQSLGKLWVTPFGCFSTLKQVEDVTGLKRMTIQRRIYSKQKRYQNWYIIDGNSDLQAAEDCQYCDELDDSLFYENCWLCHVNHVHGEPLTDDTTFMYLYSGKSYEVTYGSWLSGFRKHLELGELVSD